MKKCILLCVVALSCATLASCGRSEQEAVRACYQAAKQLIEDGQYDAAKKMINETASKYGDGALLDSLLEQLEPTAVSSPSEAETTEAQTEIETTKPPIRPESDPDDDSVNALWDTGSSLEEMDAFWDAQAGVKAEETIAQTDLYIWEDDSLWTEDTQLPQATQTQPAEEDQTDVAEASVGSKKTAVTNAEAIRSEETQAQTQKPVQTSQTQKTVQTSQAQSPAQTLQTQQSAQISDTPAMAENNTRMQAMELAKENKKATVLSRSQMIDRIREKGFSASDAVYAADHCGADWNIQAFKAAKQLIAAGGYSRDGLKKVLRQAGFSESEAAYAVDRIDVDWNAQAVKTVQKQASGQSGYSYEDLKDMLQSNGFSENEAAYALEKAGIDRTAQVAAAAEN